MTDRNLLYIWAGAYALCAGLGFVSNPGAGWVLTVLSLLFFVPPSVLLYRGGKKTVRLVRNICIISLSVTVLMIVLNMLAVTASDAAGKVLYWLLILLTAPMVCSQAWVVSLFCWACLLMAALRIQRNGRD